MNLKSIAAFLALSLYSMNSSAISLAYYLFPLEQSSFEVDSNTANKQSFNFDIKRHCFQRRCPVTFGLKYASRRAATNNVQERSAHIREIFFPEGGRRPRFPIGTVFVLQDANSKVIINHTKPSEEFRDGYIHGGTTVTSVFGKDYVYCLSPGKYTAGLQILSAERDVSEFNLHFVVLNDFKGTCGDSQSESFMDKEFIDKVDQSFSRAPKHYREQFREAIRTRKVELGMWPTEVLLAAGGGVYRVKADPKIWEKNSDPLKVMRAQSISPDESEIEIRFQNSWQFEGGIPTKFIVNFKHGVVTDIVKTED